MLERYKEWVRRHPGIVQNLDWLLLLTVWNPSRTSGRSEATYEAYHAAVGLLSLWHQHIIEEQELPTSRPTPYLLLDALEYVETLIELRGMRLEAAGKMSRYSPLLAVELVKAGLKMAAWSRYSGHMFLRRPSPDDLHQFESELGLQDILASLERLRSRYTDRPHQQQQGTEERLEPERQEHEGEKPQADRDEGKKQAAEAEQDTCGAGTAGRAGGGAATPAAAAAATAAQYGLQQFLGEHVGDWAASLYGAVAAVADATCQRALSAAATAAAAAAGGSSGAGCGAGCSKSADAAAACRRGMEREQAEQAVERARSGVGCSTSYQSSAGGVGGGGGGWAGAASGADRRRAVERWEWPDVQLSIREQPQPQQQVTVSCEIQPQSQPQPGAAASKQQQHPPSHQRPKVGSTAHSHTSAGGSAACSTASASATSGSPADDDDPEAHMGRNLLWLSELLNIWRPVVYVSMLRRYGRRSWRPWFASLAVDLLSGHFYRRGRQHLEAAAARAAARAAAAEAAGFAAEGESEAATQARGGGRGAGAPAGPDGKPPQGGTGPGAAAAGPAAGRRPPLAVPHGAGSSLLSLALARSLAAPGISPGEERELYERRRKLLLYALRSPFLEATTLSWLSSLRSATARLPLLGAGADYLYGLVDTFTAYYCYTSGSN